MFPLHCNNCFKKREPQNPLQLNRCYHVICNGCKSKFSDGNKCPVCKQPTKGIPITRDMPSSVANYFQDPSVFLKMYKSISKFQADQYALFFKHFYEQQKIQETKKEKLQGYLKLEAHLRQQIESEKKRIAELRNYAAYYKQNEGVNISSSSSNLSRLSRNKRRPRTPAFSVSELSEVSDNSANFSGCLRELKDMVDNLDVDRIDKEGRVDL